MTDYPIERICIQDTRVPALLRQIADPPDGLFVRGELRDAPAIAVVGTRRMTSYGRRAVRELVHDLVSYGFAIVSGLALGIDGEAHKAALDAGGYTIAVLATGIDDSTIYPREHLALAKRILLSGGALISEVPEGSPSFKFAFPKRNRLIAGLCPATIVVEAMPGSGSLITARLALEGNREVLAVPGPIWSATSSGCHELIGLGAKICTNAQNVIDALEMDQPALVAETRASMPLTADEGRLLEILDQPLHIDQISELERTVPGVIGSRLSLLELKGYVEHLGGQIWLKKGNLAKKSAK